MKVDLPLPTIKSLSELYDQFLIGEVGEIQLVLASQWCRFDPRLGEIWINYMSKNWKNYNPLELRTKVHQSPWPSSFAVLIEHLLLVESRALFSDWTQILLRDLSPNSFQLYFISLRKIAGKLMQKDLSHNLFIFEKWGYFCSEPLVALPAHQTLVPKKRRLHILSKFVKRKKRFSVSEYMNELGKHVSRRTAERDLQQHPNLHVVGNTKGKRYYTREKGSTS
ncbi:MAG: hypothetical protein R3A11_07250 [Bdellovibrionota bacterium]